jgi:hypothetical protein
MRSCQLDTTTIIDSSKALRLFILTQSVVTSPFRLCLQVQLSFPMAGLLHSRRHNLKSTIDRTRSVQDISDSNISCRALHSLRLVYTMCSQEYISLQCDVCSKEYSHYKPRTGGFQRCTDKPCEGLTNYTTPVQGGTCASCIMVEKREDKITSAAHPLPKSEEPLQPMVTTKLVPLLDALHEKVLDEDTERR